MDAIVITAFGGPEVLQVKRVEKPAPKNGEALIRVKAFGLNHAEMHMRRGEWDEYDPISGFECAGVVEACPGGELPINTHVVAVMGGMGRSRPGSYGELVTVSVAHIIPIKTTLSWAQLAVFPEIYCTAWCCVCKILDLRAGETLLVRGATSTLGQAAVNLAVNVGAKVTETTRQLKRVEFLKGLGAADVKLEASNLGEQFAQPLEFDKVLNLVGNTVLLETMSLTRAGGRMLQAGWLGGLEPLPSFNPMLDMKPGVHFSLFHSGKVLGLPDFPLSEIPLQDIVRKVEEGQWNADPSHVFKYSEIVEAHRILDSQGAGGKIVVTH